MTVVSGNYFPSIKTPLRGLGSWSSTDRIGASATDNQD